MAKMDVPAETLPVRGATELVATIPVPASPSGGQSGMPGRSRPVGSSSAAPASVSVPAGRPATAMAGSSSARVSSTPASAASWSNRASIVASYPPVVGVDRDHAAGIPDAEDLLAGELPVHVAGQGRQVVEPTDVVLAVQDRLVEVRDAPPVRDVDAELRAEPLGGPTRVRVAPGAERREQRTVGVEREVAVHHRRHPEGADSGQLDPVASPHVVGQGREALLHPCPDGVQRVRPHAGPRTGSPSRGCRRRAERDPDRSAPP